MQPAALFFLSQAMRMKTKASPKWK